MKKIYWLASAAALVAFAGFAGFIAVSCGGGGGSEGNLWTMTRSSLGADTYETHTVSGSGATLQAAVTPSAVLTTVDLYDYLHRGPYVFDPDMGNLYVVVRTTDPGYRILSVDPDTGADNLVNDGSLVFGPSGSAEPIYMFLDSGSLWIVNRENGITLREMDPADGTVLKTSNVASSYMNTLFDPETYAGVDYMYVDKCAFDGESGTLYCLVALSNNKDGLLSVDIDTGVATAVGTHDDGMDHKSLFWMGSELGMLEVDSPWNGPYMLSEVDTSTGARTELDTYDRDALAALFGSGYEGYDRVVTGAWDAEAEEVYVVLQSYYWDVGITASLYKEIIVSLDPETGEMELLDSSPNGLTCCDIDWYAAIWVE